ncbi:MAG: HD domain-containing protein [Solobacterium sp.]|nr:HD domain-containing protein [Solobacterium sp.]
MTKIKDLKEKDRMTLNLLIKSNVKGVTQKGAPYLNLVLQDSSGVIDGKFWDVRPEEMACAETGKVAAVTFEVLEYNHNLQLRVNRVTPVDQDTVDMSEYVMSSAKSTRELQKMINGYVSSVSSLKYRMLVQGMFDKVGKKFYEYPAASRIHHNYMGGLAEHTLGMAALAEQIISLYPQLNRDLLISGVLIHDMGKTAELGGLISADYTTEGRLTGHISICHGWLMEVAAEKGLADTEEAVLLRHMVLSHHGKYEFGSPVLPLLQEAEILNMIDNIDARMNTLRQAFETVKPGQWTSKLFALENRQFYKPKED